MACLLPGRRPQSSAGSRRSSLWIHRATAEGRKTTEYQPAEVPLRLRTRPQHPASRSRLSSSRIQRAEAEPKIDAGRPRAEPELPRAKADLRSGSRPRFHGPGLAGARRRIQRAKAEPRAAAERDSAELPRAQLPRAEAEPGAAERPRAAADWDRRKFHGRRWTAGSRARPQSRVAGSRRSSRRIAASAGGVHGPATPIVAFSRIEQAARRGIGRLLRDGADQAPAAARRSPARGRTSRR